VVAVAAILVEAGAATEAVDMVMADAIEIADAVAVEAEEETAGTAAEVTTNYGKKSI